LQSEPIHILDKKQRIEGDSANSKYIGTLAYCEYGGAFVLKGYFVKLSYDG
jgi:hypothetical protein